MIENFLFSYERKKIFDFGTRLNFSDPVADEAGISLGSDDFLLGQLAAVVDLA